MNKIIMLLQLYHVTVQLHTVYENRIHFYALKAQIKYGNILILH